MAYDVPPDVQQDLSLWVASGKYASEDEVLRDALRALADEEDLNAVRAAIAEVQAGDAGVPLQQAFDELRSRHGVVREP
ncbi:MAG TPA: type II toxin-antitoxin system ParD family antitoxin [Pirellulales bacterium]|nr:type II toxin-antitoxin system ParD family antitoxin [Pirellulales bacterium]